MIIEGVGAGASEADVVKSAAETVGNSAGEALADCVGLLLGVNALGA